MLFKDCGATEIIGSLDENKMRSVSPEKHQQLLRIVDWKWFSFAQFARYKSESLFSPRLMFSFILSQLYEQVMIVFGEAALVP